MTDSQYYGGSYQEMLDSQLLRECREKCIKNGFTVRREKRGNETVVIITPKETASAAQPVAAA